MKNIIIQMLCLFLLSSLHGMERELLLKKKDRPVYKKIQKNVLDKIQPEKLFLLGCMSFLNAPAKLKVIDYMVKLHCHDKQIMAIGKTQKEMAQEIDALQKRIRVLMEKTNQYYDIKVNTNDCARVVKGAGAGGCCGCLSGAVANSVAGFVSQYSWACCNIMIPSNILCDMMAWGLPVCTCVGCVTGCICAETRYYKKFKFTID